VAREALYPATVVIAVRDDASHFGPRVRALVADIDPTLRVERLGTPDEMLDLEAGLFLQVYAMIGLGTLTALMLSLAGLYAVMSFSVARRTREIGLRIALGASTSRLVLGTFRRPIGQVLAGILVGAVMLLGAFRLMFERGPTTTEMALIGVHVVAMLCVSLTSCVVPTRRALRIEPRDALNVEG
jgi:ABC-type antimicrobial peptide transport system permease subunit